MWCSAGKVNPGDSKISVCVDIDQFAFHCSLGQLWSACTIALMHQLATQHWSFQNRFYILQIPIKAIVQPHSLHDSSKAWSRHFPSTISKVRRSLSWFLLWVVAGVQWNHYCTIATIRRDQGAGVAGMTNLVTSGVLRLTMTTALSVAHGSSPAHCRTFSPILTLKCVTLVWAVSLGYCVYCLALRWLLGQLLGHM